jgi:transcriptional regulator with XRE-family HTH domain
MMTPQRFKQCLEQIGWTLRGVADRLGLPPTRIRRWADGEYAVPAEVARWLDKLASTHERMPPPEIE